MYVFLRVFVHVRTYVHVSVRVQVGEKKRRRMVWPGEGDVGDAGDRSNEVSVWIVEQATGTG